MIKIYEALITDFTQADYTKEYILLDCAFKEKICAKKSQLDKMRSLAGRILLRRGAAEIYAKTEFDITYNKNSKPLTDFCFFNISHSENRVVCVFADGPVGIDIQKIIQVRKREKYKFFTDFENAYINADENLISQRYTEVFAKKEAALKMLGLSIAEFGKIDTFSKEYKLSVQAKDGFVMAVCLKNS